MTRTQRRNPAANNRRVATSNADNEIHVTTDAAYLTREEVAQRLKLSIQTLHNWASKKKGPPFIKMASGSVRYPVAGLLAWEQDQLAS